MMRTFFILAIGLLFLIRTSHAQTRAREEILFNFDWGFLKGNPGDGDFQNIDERYFYQWIDESDWEEVQLPHDASVGGKFSLKNSTRANGWLPFGNGWYRKHFKVAESSKEKKVFIQFEGIYRDAGIYINGIYLGRHLNGYLGFEYDLTKYINFGGDNVIAVRYNNSKRETSRWYTGEGIYRDVWLKITDKLYIPQYGTCITSPIVNRKQSVVNVETKIVNEYEDRKMVRLVTEINDPAGTKVAGFVSLAPLSSGENFRFIQEIEVDMPELWSCENPNLYKVVSKVYSGDVLVDDYETTFGIREIRMTPDKGLLINGEKVVAKGGNMHHDLGCLGSAALEKGYERKLKRLKEMGCNSIRLSHNPHAPILLDLADRLGFLIINEAYDKWTSQYYGRLESFEDNWKKDLTTFIKRDRNHPSVFLWSMGNEVRKQQGRFDAQFETPAAASDYGVDLYKRMVGLARQLDPSRKVTVGLFPAREKFVREWEHWDDYGYFKKTNPAEMAFYGDVVSWNYTENMFEYDHKKYPQLMFIASETGTNLDFGTRKNSWLEIDKDYVIGHYYWTATDYLGESVWPTKVWGRAFLDITDEMTPIGYLYKSLYDNRPMVHIAVYEQEGQLKEWFDKTSNKRWSWYPLSDHWNWRSGEVKVQAITNAGEVELFLNGESLGVKKYSDKYQTHIDWEVPYKRGELKAVARNNGKIVAEHILKTAGEPVAIKLESDVESLKATGLDLAYIKVSLVDKDGIIVPNADRQINFSVEGEAYLAGVANGDIFSNELWVASKRSTFKGKCMLVVRSTLNAGKVIIKANTNGLPEETLVLNCK